MGEPTPKTGGPPIPTPNHIGVPKCPQKTLRGFQNLLSVVMEGGFWGHFGGFKGITGAQGTLKSGRIPNPIPQPGGVPKSHPQILWESQNLPQGGWERGFGVWERFWGVMESKGTPKSGAGGGLQNSKILLVT